MKEEKIAGSRRRTRALLISQAPAPPGSLSTTRMEAQGRRPQHGSARHQRVQRRQGGARTPGAKGLITLVHGSEHPGAMEPRLRGDQRSSKRFPLSQETNN